jgi:hypothetical protein
VENNTYFNYFTEVEDRFCLRRGTGLILSTVDWALIETWKDAGIPLEAVLRGIDAAFDKYDSRPRKTRKVNSLAYCSQQVLTAAEDMQAAAEGASRATPGDSGFESADVAAYLTRNAEALDRLNRIPTSAVPVVQDAAKSLRQLGSEAGAGTMSLEDLERRLTVIEDKLFGVLLAATPDEQIVAVRAEVERELAPYRSKMIGPQVDQLIKKAINKRLLETYGVPRLSLFYMG